MKMRGSQRNAKVTSANQMKISQFFQKSSASKKPQLFTTILSSNQANDNSNSPLSSPCSVISPTFRQSSIEVPEIGRQFIGSTKQITSKTKPILRRNTSTTKYKSNCSPDTIAPTPEIINIDPPDDSKELNNSKPSNLRLKNSTENVHNNSRRLRCQLFSDENDQESESDLVDLDKQPKLSLFKLTKSIKRQAVEQWSPNSKQPTKLVKNDDTENDFVVLVPKKTYVRKLEMKSEFKSETKCHESDLRLNGLPCVGLNSKKLSVKYEDEQSKRFDELFKIPRVKKEELKLCIPNTLDENFTQIYNLPDEFSEGRKHVEELENEKAKSSKRIRDLLNMENEDNLVIKETQFLDCQLSPKRFGCGDDIGVEEFVSLCQNINGGSGHGVVKHVRNESEIEVTCIPETLQVDDEELLKCFDKMSPFKMPVETKIKKTVPFLSGLGRHVVTNVHSSCTESEIVLDVKSEEDGVERICRLRECWTQVHIKAKDVVNILATFDKDGETIIDNSSGLLVVTPDHLITGTAVVSTLFCMRKSVLMEKFRGNSPGNFAMVCGRLVHEIFQEVMKKRSCEIEDIAPIMQQVLKHSSNLHAMYGAGVTELEVTTEIDKFIPQMQMWFKTYVLGGIEANRVRPNGNSNKETMRITQVHDIEENIWSPRYGIKGKIDLTVEVESESGIGTQTRKVMPLELKTGKSSFSPEHEGQVILYSMMVSDRRKDPAGGLLVYLRDGQTKQVVAEHNHKRGLVQLRNELVYYLDQHQTNDGSLLPYPRNHILPEPLDNKRSCSNCQYLTVCCVQQRLDDRKSLPPNHAMSQLIPKTTEHLSDSHLEYFSHWSMLLTLESKSTHFNFLNAIYCQSSQQREESGEAFTQMKVGRKNSVRETSNGYFSMKFERKLTPSSATCPRQLNTVGVVAGDMVVISCEETKEFAVASGTVTHVADDYVEVEIDKNLSVRPDFDCAVFRLDRYSYGNLMATAAGNLVTLMQNSVSAGHLRQLIIDKETPNYLKGLKKDVFIVGKPILKGLNEPQLRAIFKSLMTKDYLLIKGMPGTGKTSTIVALVRTLDALGHSVLLTSYTHSAVDNILLKLKKFDVDFVRLGRLQRIHKDIIPQSAEKLVSTLTTVQELKDFYQSKRIFATTCLGTNHISLSHKHFDFCIVDEATQVMQIACLGPLLLADRFILIGDPLQLPPIITNKIAKQKGMDQSLFLHLDSPNSTMELTLQYRMNGEIMHLANELVYGGSLKCGTNATAAATLDTPELNSLKWLPSDSWLRPVLSRQLQHSALFLDTDKIPCLDSTDDHGIKNYGEAEVIMLITRAFKMIGTVPLKEIGVISPYSRQVKYLRDQMTREDLSAIEVNTVDQYQGRDKRLILVSFVRSSSITQQLGEILHDLRRLNVAITRAKHKLILIGSRTTLTNYPPIAKLFQILRPDQIIQLPTDSHHFQFDSS